MKKSTYSLKNSFKKQNKTSGVKKMKPGSDKSLKRIFKQIGKPGKSKFKPDLFQLQAIKAIEKSDCLVTAPTGQVKPG
jgi:hypothetical protein